MQVHSKLFVIPGKLNIHTMYLSMYNRKDVVVLERMQRRFYQDVVWIGGF